MMDCINNNQIVNTVQSVDDVNQIIVEAPKLKDGQIYSSGGVRENGKIIAQYKNPRPYYEPQILKELPNNSYTIGDRVKDQVTDLAISIGKECILMIWKEFVKPLIHSGLNQLCQKKAINEENILRTNSSAYSDNRNATMSKYIQKEERCLEDGNKIISFPQRRVS